MRISKFQIGNVLVSVLVAGFISAPIAHADSDDLVCGASRLGESPGEIAEQLHEGDGRYSIWSTTQTVWSDLQDCS